MTIMITSFKMFEEKVQSRKMMNLLNYFHRSREGQEEDLPRFFDDNYPHVLEDWCMNNSEYFVDMEGYETEEEAMENITYPTTRFELSEYPEAYESYQEFLVKVIDDLYDRKNPYNLNMALLPLYVSFGYEGEVEDDWIIHFTGDKENINSILKCGYFHGLPNMDYLAISAASEEYDYDKDGYCFGFHIDDVQENFKLGYGHYGDSGIIFKGSGVKLYHNGDDETQTIFIGEDVSNMIPFWFNSKKKEFYNKDGSIRMEFGDIDEFFERLTKKGVNENTNYNNHNRYLYHGTSKGACIRIQKEGIIPQNDVGEGEKTSSFSESIDWAGYYQKMKGGYLLRVPFQKSYFHLSNRIRDNKGAEWVTNRIISPERIDIMVGGSWIPILKYDLIDRVILERNERNEILDKVSGDDIPNRLYHATYRPYLKSIMKFGLNPDKVKMKSWDFSESGVIYLAKDSEDAFSFAESSDDVPESYLDKIVILVIDTDKIDSGKLYYDRNTSYSFSLSKNGYILKDDNELNSFEYHGVIPWDSVVDVIEE